MCDVNVAARPGASRLQRGLELVLASAALLLALPVMLAIALALRLEGRGPVLFAQTRLGHGGVPFRLHKFRTLAVGRASVAAADDPRASRLGRWLRRTHLDELPQLVDVLRGRMALVGPRPEVPDNLAYVDPGDLERLLTVRPGLTGRSQLDFLAEDEVLAEVEDPVAAYQRVLVPAKLRRDLAWLRQRSLTGDLWLLLATPVALCSRRARQRARQRVRAVLARHPRLRSGRRAGTP